jgi:hypothetical protein
MFDKRKYKAKFYLVSGVGAGLILSLALGLTYFFWQLGVEEKIYANHMTTSVFFTEGLSVAGAATPWALISINWLACKTSVSKWRKYVKRKFNH